ncbi:hypothetical protein NX059_005910 [Plenodomus lindquistii]|nr:hypothetical protein NX059_005910 [Plenodomus lindquistii]
MNAPKRQRVDEQADMAEQPSTQPQYDMLLETEDDYRVFNETFTKYSTANLLNIRVLTVHVDTDKLHGLTELRIAAVLRAFHPAQNGTNPHRIQSLYIVVEGPVLLTRHDYHVSSPSASPNAERNLQKLSTMGLSREEKLGLAYMLSSTESSIANAFLAIRGVKEVFIQGKGRVEGHYAQTLLDTMVQPPGTPIIQSSQPAFPFVTEEIYQSGDLPSESYKFRALRPYQDSDQSEESTRRGGGCATRASQTKGRLQPAEQKRKMKVTGLDMADMVPIRQDKSNADRTSLDGDDSIELGWKVKMNK